MSIVEVLGQSAGVMLLGMSVVFSFLIVLIFAIKLSSFVIHALGFDKEPEKVVRANGGRGGVDKGVVAAITVAVKQYENEK